MLLKEQGLPFENNYGDVPPGMESSLPPFSDPSWRTITAGDWFGEPKEGDPSLSHRTQGGDPHFTEQIRQYMKENPDNPGQVPLGATSKITPSVMPPNAKFSDYTPSQ